MSTENSDKQTERKIDHDAVDALYEDSDYWHVNTGE